VIASVKESRLESLRIAAAGAVGAVTFLWAGRFHPALFQAGTVLLTVSLIPLAAGLRTRGGLLLGLLFGLVWIAAGLEMDDRPLSELLLNRGHLGALGAITAIGGLAGGFLGSRIRSGVTGQKSGIATRAAVERDPQAATAAGMAASGVLRDALQQSQGWLDEWDRRSEPWASFDQHLRDLLGRVAGARRVRCYRLGRDGHIGSLSHADTSQSVAPRNEGLVGHVLTSGRRYLARSATTPPTVRTLAEAETHHPAWIIPVYHRGAPVGLITADGFDSDLVDTERCELAADLVQGLWEHVHEANELRLARLMDQASGLLNRSEFMGVLGDLMVNCHTTHEPVVVLAVCLEGLRRLDDAGDWTTRDRVVETTGQTIRAALRREDVVGRFSDALFVAVLRRLDVPLAGLIAQNLLKNVEQAIGLVEVNRALRLRAGLSGSGFDWVPPDALLQQAFAALRAARAEGRILSAGSPGNSVGEVRP
jgi:diguanylate cyclase (GGDEF)-like protein